MDDGRLNTLSLSFDLVWLHTIFNCIFLHPLPSNKKVNCYVQGKLSSGSIAAGTLKMWGKYIPYAKVAYLGKYYSLLNHSRSVSCRLKPIKMDAGGVGGWSCSMVGSISPPCTCEFMMFSSNFIHKNAVPYLLLPTIQTIVPTPRSHLLSIR